MVAESCHVLGKTDSEFDLDGLHIGIGLSTRCGATPLTPAALISCWPDSTVHLPAIALEPNVSRRLSTNRLRASSVALKGIEESEMHTQSNELQGTQYSPTRIRATWDGTGSVEDASKALGFSRAKGYDLVRRGEFPCRVLRVGRTTRVVTASLLRVLESGEPEYNGARRAPSTPA
ncbi:helix-turn-helix domain-containing protein [Streptomyces sp. NPDC056831]|uniref:helix-turn-helix domain-containing protein n=1 Tax=Streptomyces sp. NPDC056831 TaxID=3345954 RepID=UPI0036BAE35F